MNIGEARIRQIAAAADSRLQLWIQLLRTAEVESVAEIGVWRGDFAAQILAACSSINAYYMIDPWRHLDDWNKPANQDDLLFEQFLAKTKEKTEFAADKRVILRGKTTEVIDEIPDGSLDFVYIDGDHTLRGISIDLIRTYPKICVGGWIGGDDFARTMWQHRTDYEPTLVFPFAVYFAEAIGAPILALPNGQFLIENTKTLRFVFVDLTGEYQDITLRDQLHPNRILKLRAAEVFSTVPWMTKVPGNVRGLFRKASRLASH
jgi:hypothetical protein